LLRPGERFSHRTALALYGLPLPLSRDEPELELTAPQELTQVRRPGVRSHRSRSTQARVRRGFPVSSPMDLFCELAAQTSLDDLVAVGDALVLSKRMPGGNRQRPLIPLSALRGGVDAMRGRGCRQARAAIGLVQEGVESPMETRLRLLIIRAEIPEPRAGYEVRAAGRLLGFADLAWPEIGLVVEYDGDHHRTDRTQYERDIRRIESFESEDFEVLRVRRDGLLDDPDATAGRIRAAYARRANTSRARKVLSSGS
jgi:hypothetical protein